MRIPRIREILLINKIPIIQLRLWRFVIRVERYIFFFFSFFIFCHRQTDTRVLVDVRRLYMTQTRQLLDQKEKKHMHCTAEKDNRRCFSILDFQSLPNHGRTMVIVTVQRYADS